MDKFLSQFEKYVSYALIVFGVLAITYVTVELFFLFAHKIIDSIQHQELIKEEKGRPVAAIFFEILLFLEILQSVRIFAKEHTIKLRIILIIGLIAVARKILLMDAAEADPMSEFAVAALIIALSLGYFLVSKSGNNEEGAVKEQ